MIREFTIGASRVVNLGNYENIKVEASLTVEVPAGDDYEILKDRAQTELRTLMEETYRSQQRKKPTT